MLSRVVLTFGLTLTTGDDRAIARVTITTAAVVATGQDSSVAMKVSRPSLMIPVTRARPISFACLCLLSFSLLSSSSFIHSHIATTIVARHLDALSCAPTLLMRLSSVVGASVVDRVAAKALNCSNVAKIGHSAPLTLHSSRLMYTLPSELYPI